MNEPEKTVVPIPEPVPAENGGKPETDLLRRFLEPLTEYLLYRTLVRLAEEARTEYPELDLTRGLDNPEFCRLLRAGVDPATAWAAVFRAREDENRQRREALDQAKHRPGENGLRPAAPARLRTDPKALTRQERKELRRRAGRGEEITLY